MAESASTGALDRLAALKPLMDACVHCGFCLPACPSYQLIGHEMDSPRGRVYLMRAAVEGRTAPGPAFAAHFDTCLGCMACETACPSGVRYGPLLEETRAVLAAAAPRTRTERWLRRVLFAVLPSATRLRALSWPLALLNAAGLGSMLRSPLARRLPGSLRAALELAPAIVPSDLRTSVRAFTPAVGAARARVGLLRGCVQSVLFGRVNEASVRVLSADGCDVVVPVDQGCCGALGLHAGLDDSARDYAKRLIAAFERAGVDLVVANAAGCGSAMKSYGHLLRNDPAWAGRAAAFAARVRDITEVLAELQPSRAARQPLEVRYAYHDACHLAHAQGIRREPRTLLDAIPGATGVPLADADLCCGSAGIFNLVQPDMAAELGRRKLQRVIDAGVHLVVTSNPGCMLQLQSAARAAGYPLEVRHIVEILDRSMTGPPIP